MTDCIDHKGYRHNVCMVIVNDDNQVLIAKRIGCNMWQLPQGGIDQGEDVTVALFRELAEEVGLGVNDVELIARTDNWLYYDIPKQFTRAGGIVGQKQLWFLLKIKCTDEKISLENGDHAEFEAWRWTDYWQPIQHVIDFKQPLYEDGLKALAPVVFNNKHQVPQQYKRRLYCSTIRVSV